MNSFGRVFRVQIFGESHGKSIGVIIDGCPSGISIKTEDFVAALTRRKPGKRGTTTRVEDDDLEIISGIYNNFSTGSPIALLLPNSNVNSSDYDDIKYKPRPGHSDFTAFHKFSGYNDHRGGGHFSGRLTAALVLAGVVAHKVIPFARINAKILEIGGLADYDNLLEQIVQSGESVGGIVECQVMGLPIGLGEPFFDSVESVISHAVFAIPAVKGIEFGAGFKSSQMKGSEMNDQIMDIDGHTLTNNSGGINGGISNGNALIFRIAIKPTSSISQTQSTVNLQTGESENLAIRGRHDACIALRVPPVLESVTAIALADLYLLNKIYK